MNAFFCFFWNINNWRHPTHASRTSLRLKKYLLKQILFPSIPIIWIGNPSPSERMHTSVKYWSASPSLFRFQAVQLEEERFFKDFWLFVALVSCEWSISKSSKSWPKIWMVCRACNSSQEKNGFTFLPRIFFPLIF